MKSLCLVPLLLLAGACVTAAESDLDRAYSKCDSISDASSKNRCIADAIQKAQRDRADDAERLEQLDENAERRELGREIAGAREN